MYRDPEIREKISILTEELIELYELTNPKFGHLSEPDKLENARIAIDTWWQLHDHLVLWAQNHLIGYCLCYDDGKLVDDLTNISGDVTVDSHTLEIFGSQLAIDIPNEENELNDAIATCAKSYEAIDLTDFPRVANVQALRSFIVEMLASRSPNSLFWRFEAQKALRALNEGQVEEFVKPNQSKRQGMPFSLNQWKLEALAQVRFRVAKGMKKYRALEEVAEGIGQSTETLRDWEKQLSKNEDYGNELFCAAIAGYHHKALNLAEDPQTIDFPDYGSHRGRLNIEIASKLLRTIEKRSLTEIKKKLREYRCAGVSGG